MSRDALLGRLRKARCLHPAAALPVLVLEDRLRGDDNRAWLSPSENIPLENAHYRHSLKTRTHHRLSVEDNLPDLSTVPLASHGYFVAYQDYSKYRAPIRPV